MVEITLRKANEIEKLAMAAASAKRSATSIRVSVFDQRPVEELLKAAREKMHTTLADAVTLVEAAFSIRALSSVKLRESGINDLLLEQALIEAQERQLTSLTVTTTFEEDNGTIEAFAEKVKSLRARLDTATRAYGFEEAVDLNLISEADKTTFTDKLAALRKRKTKIQDELIVRNRTASINVPANIIATLARYKIDVT